MTTRQLRKFIGLSVAGGIVIGARSISPTEVEFTVHHQGEEPTIHRINLTGAQQ